MSLANLALITSAQSRRSSSYDRSGGNVDCLCDLAPGAAATLLDCQGPGQITHLWLTYAPYAGHASVLRDLVVRIFWEHSEVPSVEVPLGDFFGLGHALPPEFYAQRKFSLASSAITVGLHDRSFNCYWPMPFHQHARIEIVNAGSRSLRQLYFHVDYELGAQDPNAGLFHASFTENTELESQGWINPDGAGNFTILDTAGRGHYIGCILYVDSRRRDWFGEGDDMIFIDGDPLPTINGTGTEDYFNNAWGYNQPFSYPHYGCPLIERRPDGSGLYTLYRFHDLDPVRFASHIKVGFEHAWGDQSLSLAGGDWRNGFAATAFWYQDQPLRKRAPLPSIRPRAYTEFVEYPTAPATDLPALEVDLRRRGIAVRTVFVVGQEWIGPGALTVECAGRAVPLRVATAPGLYRVELQPLPCACDASARVGITGNPTRNLQGPTLARQRDAAFLDLGTVTAGADGIELTLQAEAWIGLQGLRVIRLD